LQFYKALGVSYFLTMIFTKRRVIDYCRITSTSCCL